MREIFSISILLLLLISISCKNISDNGITDKTEIAKFNSWRDHWENPTQKAALLSNSKIHKRIKECLNNTSIIVLTAKLIDDFR